MGAADKPMSCNGRTTTGKTMKDGIFFIIDDRNSPCGLTDRLKAAVGLCYVARLHQLDFRFIHRAGFDIREYLAPNQVHWSAELSDISALPWKKRRIRYRAPYTDLPEFRKGVQYICREYYGNNIIEKWNVPDWQQVWRELFWEMFTPTDIVHNELAACEMPERYAAVVARFINSLGHTENVEYNMPFSPEMQKKLIDAVLSRVAECERESDVPIVVYSDSVRFLEAAAANGHMITDIDGIGNIMNRDVGQYVTLRTFVNLFQIAKAEKVYSILHLDGLPENSLYNTQYPRYAAIIGDRPFVRL